MAKGRLLKANTPHVVYETIDGETIIMDLRTGNYYSIEWPGVFIWEYLAAGGNIETILIEDKRLETHEKSIQHFVNILLQESLLMEVTDESAEPAVVTDEQKADITKLAGEFKDPQISKYTDMQEMLLLDPIHDVDEKGWPEPKKEDE
jgi:hypothetical protein